MDTHNRIVELRWVTALEIIDGHLMAKGMGTALVPILIVGLDEADANQLFLTLTPRLVP